MLLTCKFSRRLTEEKTILFSIENLIHCFCATVYKYVIFFLHSELLTGNESVPNSHIMKPDLKLQKSVKLSTVCSKNIVQQL